MTEKEKWIWMPHAAHFICGYRCQFHLATYVGGYIVSTIGELPPLGHEDECFFEDIGLSRKYETMVFGAKKSKNVCCPFVQIDGNSLDFMGYNEPGDATNGHYKLCLKWSKKEAQ